MEHIDEKILKAKNQMEEQMLAAKKQMEEKEAKRHAEETIQEELKQSIYDESIQIYGIPIKFTEMKLIDNRITLRLPEDFELVSEEAIAQVYFLGNKPQYVLANDYLYFNVGFNRTEHPVPNSAIGDFSKVAKTMLERVGPKVKILDSSLFQSNDYNVATIEFISRAVDQTIYNQMFYVSLDNKLLIGFINFPSKYSKRLKPIGDEIIHSFQMNNLEEDKK